MQESLQEEYSAFEEVLEEEAVASIRMHPVKAKVLEKELRLNSSKVHWHPD